MKGTSERRRDKRARRVIGAACLLLALVRLAPMVGAPASAAELIPAATAPSEPPIVLPVGMGHLVRFDDPVKSVFLADPSIADLKVVADDLVYLYGKKSGATNLIALDIDKKLKSSVPIQVYVDASAINQISQGLQPGSKATVAILGNTPVIAGRNRTIDEAANTNRLASTLSPSGKPPLDISTLEGSNQVNIRVRFVEVSRNDLQSFGLDWSLAAKSGGIMFGKVDIDVVIEALRRAGAIHILAEPNLTSVTGQTASFLSGGEIAVPVPTGQGNMVTSQYKPYGVSLEFTPTLIKNNRIALRVKPEVSALSKMGATKSNGVDMPGFTVRRADTTVELASGQTFAIGGLFQRQTTEDLDKVPGLSEVPILGELFQSTRFRRDETELVILVTPYLVMPSRDRVPTPLDRLPARASAQDGPGKTPKRVANRSDGEVGFVHK